MENRNRNLSYFFARLRACNISVTETSQKVSHASVWSLALKIAEVMAHPGYLYPPAADPPVEKQTVSYP